MEKFEYKMVTFETKGFFGGNIDTYQMENKLNEMFSCIWCSNGSILVHNG